MKKSVLTFFLSSFYFLFYPLLIFASAVQINLETNIEAAGKVSFDGRVEDSLETTKEDGKYEKKDKMSLLVNSGDKNVFSRRELDFSHDRELSNLYLITRFVNLQSLKLTGCFFLRSIEPLSKLRNLVNLYLGSCERISDFTPLSGKKLLTLDVSCIPMKKKEKFGFLLDLGHLVSLDLSECFLEESKVSLANIRFLSSLRFLYLRMCSNMFDSNVRAISECCKLEKLDLSFTNFSLESFKIMSKGHVATTLRSLILDSVEDMNDSIGSHISSFSFLEEISLRYTEIGDRTIEGLSYISRLRKLDIAGCINVESLMPLCNKSSLRYLDVSSCFGIRSFVVLSTLKNLEELNVLDCCFEYEDDFLDYLRGMFKLRKLQINSEDFCKDVKENIERILSRNRLSSKSF